VVELKDKLSLFHNAIMVSIFAVAFLLLILATILSKSWVLLVMTIFTIIYLINELLLYLEEKRKRIKNIAEQYPLFGWVILGEACYSY
jgi:hypothetical protein